MKHTPGPWRIDEHAQIIAGKSVLGRIYCGDIFPNEDLPECNANSELIARAPELLEENESLKSINKELLYALQSVVYAYKVGTSHEREISMNMAKEDILKACGY